MGFEMGAVREVIPDAFSSSIQRFTDAKFSHVVWIIDNEFIYHADDRGVVLEPIALAVPKGSEIFDRFPVILPPTVTVPEVRAYMRGSFGIGYSFAQGAGSIKGWIPKLVRWLYRKFGKTGRSSFHCAECVADLWTHGMMLPAEHLRDIDFMNQREVFESCKAKAKEWGWLPA